MAYLLLIGLELGGGCMLQRNCQGSNLVVVGATLQNERIPTTNKSQCSMYLHRHWMEL